MIADLTPQSVYKVDVLSMAKVGRQGGELSQGLQIGDKRQTVTVNWPSERNASAFT